jgi:hypothetical protein
MFRRTPPDERSLMATTPPPDEQPTTVQPSSGTAYTVNVSDIARMPIPGNAEFLVYLLALIVAWIVCWTTDSLRANDWLFFFLFTTAAYLISRGVAKASRVLEQ